MAPVTLWKKSYDQPGQHIKKQDIALPTKVRLVKAMVFKVVMYGCESRTIKKAEVGGGFRMANTCKSMADSCQCMAKTTTVL